MAVTTYAKAITGSAVAGLTTLGTALIDNEVTPAEWVGVAVAFLGALGLVYAVPNADPEGEHQDESVQPPNA